jgi:glutamate synthase domain-containing protein 3
MSGGVLYLAPGGRMDPTAHGLSFGPTECRPSAISPDDPDAPALRALLERHAGATGSARASRLLAEWPQSLAEILRVAVPVVVPERNPVTELSEPVAAT